MTGPAHNSDKDRIIDQRTAALILERLAEIEARGGPISLADLRAAALEAGFTARAFDEALQDLSNTSVSAPADDMRKTPWERIKAKIASLWKPALVTVGVGSVVGFLLARAVDLAILTDDNTTVVEIMTAVGWLQLVGVSIYLAVRSRRKRDVPAFLLLNLLLWLGTYAGLITVAAPAGLGAEVSVAMASVASMSVLITTPIGLLITLFRNRRSSAGPNRDGEPTPVTALQPHSSKEVNRDTTSMAPPRTLAFSG